MEKPYYGPFKIIEIDVKRNMILVENNLKTQWVSSRDVKPFLKKEEDVV